MGERVGRDENEARPGVCSRRETEAMNEPLTLGQALERLLDAIEDLGACIGYIFRTWLATKEASHRLLDRLFGRWL